MVSAAAVLRTCASFGLALVGLGCGTDAVGVSDCRVLEAARCEAGEACGFPDVEGCVRFFRDHCLHGFAAVEVLEVEVLGCADEIGRAGRCAADQGPETAPTACTESVSSSAAQVCDVILSPELSTRCGFLSNIPVEAPAETTASDAGGR
jgi:hypothetical protein